MASQKKQICSMLTKIQIFCRQFFGLIFFLPSCHLVFGETGIRTHNRWHSYSSMFTTRPWCFRILFTTFVNKKKSEGRHFITNNNVYDLSQTRQMKKKVFLSNILFVNVFLSNKYIYFLYMLYIHWFHYIVIINNYSFFITFFSRAAQHTKKYINSYKDINCFV